MPDPTPCAHDRLPERPRYFSGQLLTQDDLEAEQTYLIDRLRAHNRLHGWGVVCGLGVEPTDPPTGRVVVQPGVALDCTGREIDVCDSIEIDILELIGRDRTTHTAFVTIEYGEEALDTVPGGDGSGEPTRIREVPRVAASDEPPQEPSPQTASDGVVPCPVCPDPRLTLATIDLGKRGPITVERINNRVRRPIGNQRQKPPVSGGFWRRITRLGDRG